jgi:hypothetical protein
MAHLWLREAAGEWAALPLLGAVDLGARPPRAAVDATEILLRPLAGSRGWALVARAGARLRVNGEPLLGDLRVLADRDQIRVGGETLYFTTEDPARVEPFAGAERPLSCPRCRQALAPGTAAVRCPACGVWHHQSEELPCWTYAATCALCPRATDLQAGLQWSPEEP